MMLRTGIALTAVGFATLIVGLIVASFGLMLRLPTNGAAAHAMPFIFGAGVFMAFPGLGLVAWALFWNGSK